MAETKTMITADQFSQMSFPDVRTELVDGEIVKMSPAGFDHADICAALIEHMRRHARAQNAGRVVSEGGFVLRSDPDLVRGPDVAFISAARLKESGRTRKFWPGPPDLAVEVLSPDDRVSEVLRKVGDYLEAGTRLVWVVDPGAQTVTVYRSLQSIRIYRADEELSGEDVLPGFRLRVSEIFV